ncbi:MAG: NADPH-dependent FMN reductase [Halolamina sp.]
MTHVVAVCGSLRDRSRTRWSLEVALEGAEGVGADTELLDLREFDLPAFDPDRESPGDSERLVDRIGAAHSILLGTPMYHGSYSSVLKTALDYCGFEEFENKTVGLLAVSGGAFPVSALEHLRSTCRALNAWVLPHQAAVPRSGGAFEDGEIVDENLAQRVRTLGVRAVQYADISPDPGTFESDQNVGG